MSDHDRAAQLVAEVLDSWRRDEFDSASPLADGVDTEETAVLAANLADVRAAVEAVNYRFNLTVGQGGTPIPHGTSAALTGDFDDRIRNLSEIVLSRHRAIDSERLWVIDHQLSEDGSYLLPLWDRDNPWQANVIRGLVATHPQMVYVLRGGFTPDHLATAIWKGIIPTVCNLNVSPNCDIKAHPPADWRDDRKIWGMFSTAVGEHLIFHTMCGPCFFRFWPMDETGASANHRIY